MSKSTLNGAVQIRAGTLPLDRLVSGYSIPTANLADGANFLKRDGSVPLTADWALGNFKLTSLADATNPQDAVNLRTAQALVNGVAIKRARGVAITNQALSGLPTNDGITFTATQVILLTAQTTASQNGPWAVAAGSWSRPADWSAASSQKSTMFLVEEGTTNHDTKWLAISDAITVDTTSVTIVQDSSGVSYVNGAGLALTGNTFSVKLLSTGGLSFDGSSNVQIALNGSSLNLSGSGIKITDATSPGQVMIGNGSNAATFTSLSGDISSISGAGAVTLATTVLKTTGLVQDEIPSGTINGVNATFTLAFTPIAGTVKVYLNGQRMFPGAGNDFTISGATITMLQVPVTGDLLVADYNK